MSVAVEHGAGLHAGGVRPSRLLGHAEADARLALDQRPQVFLFLRLGAMFQDRQHRGVIRPLAVHRPRGQMAARHLDLDDGVGEWSQAHASPRRGHVGAPQSRPTRFLLQRREHLVGRPPVQLLLGRQAHLLHELAHPLPERLRLRRDLKVDHFFGNLLAVLPVVMTVEMNLSFPRRSLMHSAARSETSQGAYPSGRAEREVPMEGSQSLFDLSGKVALVTGGSRGLGRAMVLAFARAGADVIIASRKREACEEIAGEVVRTTGRRALPAACNVSEWGQVEALAERAYAECGKVDILVNNAGMSPLYDHVANVTEALWDKVLGVNLKGPFRLTALVGTRMAEGDGGSIIMVSTVGSLHPRANVIPYAAAKAGLNAMTVGFADAFAPKVRVNCILPGAFRTDVTRAWDMVAFQRRAESGGIFLRRIGEPDEIVGAALYFASSASSYTTGALLEVSGGAAGAS
jgi:NAD(P)-dependent dehydrogenase (short-subunit alcohol dehydrogenase family)